MEKEITLREWVENFKASKYDDPSRDVQIDAGWYDWFCNDSSLQRKTKKIGKILCKITNDYLLDNYYVWFKNNCPICHPLYDDFRFEPMNEDLRDSKYFVVSINERDWKETGKYKVYTARKNYDLEFNATSTKELVEKLNNLGKEFSEQIM